MTAIWQGRRTYSPSGSALPYARCTAACRTATAEPRPPAAGWAGPANRCVKVFRTMKDYRSYPFGRIPGLALDGKGSAATPSGNAPRPCLVLTRSPAGVVRRVVPAAYGLTDRAWRGFVIRPRQLASDLQSRVPSTLCRRPNGGTRRRHCHSAAWRQTASPPPPLTQPTASGRSFSKMSPTSTTNSTCC